MNDDIVARLRDIEGGYGFRGICREAAAEIERLRAIVEAWKTSSSRAERDIAELRAERDRMRQERDEARRDRCMARAVIRWDLEHPNSPQRTETTIILLAWQIADEEGWDCFEGMKR